MIRLSKKFWTYLIGILLIIGGSYLLFNPKQTFSTLVYYMGLAILIYGLVRLISSIINKATLTPGSGLSTAIINTIFGIILMKNSEATLKIIPIFISIWLIISASTELAILFKYKNVHLDASLIVSNLGKLILGLCVFTMPIIPVIFTGWILGVILIIIGIYTVVNYKEKDSVYKVKIK